MLALLLLLPLPWELGACPAGAIVTSGAASVLPRVVTEVSSCCLFFNTRVLALSFWGAAPAPAP